VRWSPTGDSILVGGQEATVKQMLTCFESSAVNCNVPFRIYSADPETLKLTYVVPSEVYGVFGVGTGAIQVGNKIWVNSFHADRVGIFQRKQWIRRYADRFGAPGRSRTRGSTSVGEFGSRDRACGVGQIKHGFSRSCQPA
jgi:hypothetical protein